MSYIRLGTTMCMKKRDKRFQKTSCTYAWSDIAGYVHITNGWARTFEALLKSKRFKSKKEAKAYFDKQPHLLQSPEVILTPAEMRYMCRQYLRQHGELAKKQRTSQLRQR